MNLLRRQRIGWILASCRRFNCQSTLSATQSRDEYTRLIRKCCKTDDVNGMKELVREMEDKEIGPSLANYSTLLHLLGKRGQADEMMQIREKMSAIGMEPDESVYANLVIGLSNSGRIENAVEILKEMQTKEVQIKARSYNTLISKAAQLGFPQESSRLLRQMRRDYDLLPDDNAFASVIAVTENESGITELMKDFRAAGRLWPQKSFEALRQWFVRENQSAIETSVDENGSCQACGLTLESIELPPERKAALVEKTEALVAGFETASNLNEVPSEKEEWRTQKLRANIARVEAKIEKLEAKTDDKQTKMWYQQLASCRSRLATLQSLLPPTLSKWLAKRNLKAPTQEQMQSFKAWMNEVGPCDVVIDGLNVAHFYQTGINVWLVFDVIQHYQQIGKRTVVFFRNHIKTNKRHIRPLRCISEKSEVYYIADRLADDYFFLYAALHNGLDVELVSNDLMRDHHQLYHGPLFNDFLKWQRGHQVTIKRFEKDHRPIFQPRKLHDTITQWTPGSRHIPGEEDNQWLCVTST
eukprot:m.25341 g.25341  ORF g.25341 m.25341 type:complete len:528 (+) comp28787_c0_seq2:352-1935(+)